VPDDSKKQIDLLGLRKRLDAAVKAEDYETAAKLRDEINRLQ
jgi:protein-arginine kinase activator protein McsA